MIIGRKKEVLRILLHVRDAGWVAWKTRKENLKLRPGILRYMFENDLLYKIGNRIFLTEKGNSLLPPLETFTYPQDYVTELRRVNDIYNEKIKQRKRVCINCGRTLPKYRQKYCCGGCEFTYRQCFSKTGIILPRNIIS
jgi:ribosomal protein S27AE